MFLYITEQIELWASEPTDIFKEKNISKRQKWLPLMHTNPGPENKSVGTFPVQRDLSFLAEYAKLWPMQSYHDHPITV